MTANGAVVNRATAEAGDLRIGDTTVLRTPEPLRITVVGLVTFGTEDGMGPATYTGLTRADAERYLTSGPGKADSIQLRAGPGVGRDELVARIRPVLPDGVEAITGDQASEESLDLVSGRFLTMFTALLTVFAGIALLVATFSIHNTFATVVAQRTRENALLRTLGAGLHGGRGLRSGRPGRGLRDHPRRLGTAPHSRLRHPGRGLPPGRRASGGGPGRPGAPRGSTCSEPSARSEPRRPATAPRSLPTAPPAGRGPRCGRHPSYPCGAGAPPKWFRPLVSCAEPRLVSCLLCPVKHPLHMMQRDGGLL